MKRATLTLAVVTGLMAPSAGAAGVPDRNDVSGTSAAIKVLGAKRDGSRVVSHTVSAN